MLTITGTACCLASIVVGVFGISVNSGGYEDVNIVIQDTVAENETLLERIQEVFTKSSQLLFEATRHHVYFRQVNIILPKSWSSKPEYTEIPALSEQESYITVEEGKVTSPYTKRKKKRCGYPGWYIYLPTDFLFTKGKTDFGNHENVLVHEWGHLRWGLFEEYGTKRKGRFYLDNGIWNPVRCSESVSGKVGQGTDCRTTTSECKTTDTSQMMNKACKFCPNESQVESNLSSILAFNWVDGVSTFCDKEDDETVPVHQRHNSKAPNKHNSKCAGRSAWEVMREHDDFKTAPLPASTNTTPIFSILRETDGYRVFVLDVSSSMRGTRIKTLYQACEYIIQTKIPEDSWLGIVPFSTDASTLKDITRVTSQQVRDALIAAVPKNVSGSTCIGCGIDEALSILSSKRGDPAGSEILVISDGQNNYGSLDMSIQNATEANAIIHTISVSQAADKRMISMATATGGKHLSYLETGRISFASGFMEILSSGVTSFATESTTLLSEKLDSLSSNTVSFSFDIDSSVGMNTTVSILQGSSTDISMEVQSPDGTVYTDDTTGDSLILDIPGTILPGKYNVTVTTQTSNSSSFEYHVTSLPTGSEVVRVSSWVTPINVDFLTGDLPVIEADVTKGRAAVLNAIVTAVVETGRSESCEVALLDDGADPDDDIGDGVYAGVIPRLCLDVNGRVSAKVYARGEKGITYVQDVSSGAGSPNTDNDVNSTKVLEDSFQRVTLPNVILVSNYSTTIASQDITAPGRITDVSIIDISAKNTQYGESRNFTITWTATGDDINVGQATEYELRISDDINVLINNFSAAELLDVVNANFTPKVAGEVEFIRIEIDAEESYTSTTFFGVKAKDEAGNVRAVSNIVSVLVANGYRIKVKGDVYSKSYTDEAIEEDDIEEEKKKNLTTLIIGLSSASGVIFIAIIAVTICMKKLKAKKSVEDCEFGIRASTTSIASIDESKKDFYTTMASRQTVAKKIFQSSQLPLPTIVDREQRCTTSFSSRPLSPYQSKTFDTISLGSCSFEMLNGPNNAFTDQMDDYLNTDAKSIAFEQMSPRGDSVEFDDGMTVENSPEAKVDILSEEATSARSDNKITQYNFVAVLEDMPKEFPIQTTDDNLNKEANANEIVPATLGISEGQHTRKENRKGFERELKEPYFEETCTSWSVEFPSLDNDEMK